jgi:hypothetical protein
MRTPHDAAGAGATDPLGAGEALAEGDAAGVGDEVVVGAGDEVAVEGVVVGVAVADADADGVVTAVGDVVGVSTAGAEVAGELTCPDAACPECAPVAWCADAARAIPPAADAAMRPTTMDAMASGRVSRRSRRPRCLPGSAGGGAATRGWPPRSGASRAEVTVLVGLLVSGRSTTVGVTGPGS